MRVSSALWWRVWRGSSHKTRTLRESSIASLITLLILDLGLVLSLQARLPTISRSKNVKVQVDTSTFEGQQSVIALSGSCLLLVSLLDYRCKIFSCLTFLAASFCSLLLSKCFLLFKTPAANHHSCFAICAEMSSSRRPVHRSSAGKEDKYALYTVFGQNQQFESLADMMQKQHQRVSIILVFSKSCLTLGTVCLLLSAEEKAVGMLRLSFMLLLLEAVPSARLQVWTQGSMSRSTKGLRCIFENSSRVDSCWPRISTRIYRRGPYRLARQQS